jgi:hypothetical protein
MPSEFYRLFAPLPPCITRNEDGTLSADKSHPTYPALQKVLAAIRECRDHGDSDDLIRDLLVRGAREGLRIFLEREATDGTNS